jgi:mannosyl-glycoprotein endo-beta-N-acetylglucosaminidase
MSEERILAFLKISDNDIVTENDAKSMLTGTYFDSIDKEGNKTGGYAKAFSDAANISNLSLPYLVSSALIESNATKPGHCSRLFSGNEIYKDKNVYNVYGIEAYDGAAIEKGKECAYENGWFTEREAIVGGAQYISTKYAYNKLHQDTLYKQKYNLNGYVESKGTALYPQYATAIYMAYEKAEELYYVIDKNEHIVLKIPVFLDENGVII